MRGWVFAVIGAIWIVAVGGAPQAASRQAPSGVPPAPTEKALVERYCVTCHNQRTKTAGLTLDTLDLERVDADADTWERVLRKVRGRMMPPQGMPQPDETARAALVSSLEALLDRAAAAHPNPGRPLAHRLNRAEYANAIRDLLSLDVDVVSLLPP